MQHRHSCLCRLCRCILRELHGITHKFVFLPVLLTAFASHPAAPQTPGQPDLETKLRPFLSKNCYACHSDKVTIANLNLEHPVTSPTLWEKVLDKLAAGRMPPPGSPAPPASEVASVTAWLEKSVGRSRQSAEPAHVTTRRLNRAEYNATVRDLLGVSL